MTEFRRRVRGFTLLEIVISFAVLAVLMVLCLSTIHASCRPITDTTVRSLLSTQANARVKEMTLELQSAGNHRAGTFATSFSAAAESPGGSGIYTGPAVEFQRVTGFNVTTGMVEYEVTPRVFAFVADGTFPAPGFIQGVPTPDGLFSSPKPRLKLIRQGGGLASGVQVTMLKDIPDLTATNGGPFFRLTAPSKLEVRFSVMRQIDYDTAANRRVYAQVTFPHVIPLRNAD